MERYRTKVWKHQTLSQNFLLVSAAYFLLKQTSFVRKPKVFRNTI